MSLRSNTAILALAVGISAGSAAYATEVANGLTVNGLTLNGLTVNGLTLNGLTLNGLTLNGRASQSLTLQSVSMPNGERVELR